MKELDIALCIPSTGRWEADFGISLMMLVADFSREVEGFDHQNLRIFHKQGSILPRMRQELLQRALDVGCTHVLWLDTDQKYPPNTIRQLLRAGRPVVGCNIATKSFPSYPTARYKDGMKLCYTTHAKAKLGLVEQVWRLGTGILLMDLQTFRERNVPKPWFGMRWLEEKEDFQGEDWWLCSRLEEAGIPIFVDHKLSWVVYHIGKCDYGHEMTSVEEPDSDLIELPSSRVVPAGRPDLIVLR